jgi:uncharacterized paraquat-inducible protein A
LHCARCHAHLPLRRSGWVSTCAATVALAVAPAALLLPVMRIERLGQRHESSILGAIIDLFRHGNVGLGLVILGFSVVLPVAKLSGLLVLLAPRLWRGVGSPIRQRWIYEAVEFSGRWGMVDVLLVAVLVAIVKLGDLVEVSSGPGLVAFVVMVLGSLVAGLSIHPHHLWDQAAPAPAPAPLPRRPAP